MQTDLTLRPVSTLRRLLLAVIVRNDLFTADEQLRANHNAHDCQDAARLDRWLTNTKRVAAERGALPATEQQRDELQRLTQHETTTDYMRAKIVGLLPTYTRLQARRIISRLAQKVKQAAKEAYDALLALPFKRQQALLSQRNVCKAADELFCPTYPISSNQTAALNKYLSSGIMGGKRPIDTATRRHATWVNHENRVVFDFFLN